MNENFQDVIDQLTLADVGAVADQEGGRTHKQVIIIRKDLNMRRGKQCAQAAHASWKAVLDISHKITEHHEHGQTDYLQIPLTAQIRPWLMSNFKKICVYVESEQELLDLYNKAKEHNILCSLIEDAGLTEFNNVPTYTAVAIGPDLNINIDKITSGLPLL